MVGVERWVGTANYVLGQDPDGWVRGAPTFGAGSLYVGGHASTMTASDDVQLIKLSADGSTVLYSTLLGGSSYEYLTGRRSMQAAVCSCPATRYSSDFPTANAFQANRAGELDLFVANLDGAGSGLVYSTYLGGSRHETGGALAVDAAGNAVVAGFSSSPDFPVTPGAYDTTCGADGEV